MSAASPPAPEALAFIGTSDLSGIVRGKSIPLQALERRMGRGVALSPQRVLQSPLGATLDTPFGGSAELVLVPDPSVRASLPSPGAPDLVVLLGDLLETDGAPWECCPRYFLRRGLAALHREFGLTLLAGFEQELFYTGASTRPGPGYSLEALRRQGGFGGTLLAAMRASGIMPDKFLAAGGPGQYEVAPAPAPGVAAADQAVLVRELIRAVAAGTGSNVGSNAGFRAIMAPMLGVGNATRIHWSLLDEFGRPAAYDESGALGLAEQAEHMVAGMVQHLPSLLALTCPSGASYFARARSRAAPMVAELGGERSGAIRLCPVHAMAEEAPQTQLNFEFRLSDAAANPYLALGALVWAGIDGLRKRRRLADLARTPLPQSLDAALDLFEESVAVAEWLGPELREVYSRMKRAELRALAGLDEEAVCARYAAVY